MPRALIRARIASGMTQEGLALRLGLKGQQIQRYEATEYESASFARTRKVGQALVSAAHAGNSLRFADIGCLRWY
jgi:transcriptional regulator with XRE-family HTH domain